MHGIMGYMPIFNEIIILLWLIFLIYWFISAMGSKRTIRTSGWWQGTSIRVVLLIIVLLLIHIPAFNHFFSSTSYNSSSSSSWIDSLGVAICIAGIAFAIWARVHLGRNWGMPMSEKEDSALITWDHIVLCGILSILDSYSQCLDRRSPMVLCG